ncbi:membrane protein insertase YidC [Roseomonas sp. SSH11]|uniref:Membrane protein insertase YidC n=1 Tax=Pararoseomonas baculiformis TaxID=2820812 RepID=A0ABS4AFZ0_9PROT|nr:membrane protein insertase YidC [Pararoseomonas baculiformis]MBP0445950.1 membrane protein insertase YidC [Pararoseomonas baculiformis]
MDNKRLLAAIAISIGILLLFDVWNRPAREAQRQAAQDVQQSQTSSVPLPQANTALNPAGVASTGANDGAPTGPAPRLRIESARVEGSVNLRGARIDDLVLRDYRETIQPGSPNVRILAPREDNASYFAQWGWTAADGHTAVPGPNTVWTAEGGPLTPNAPVTLRWENGTGQRFEIALSLDQNFMVTAEQRVVNTGSEPVQVLPWARVRREHTPHVAGYYILHEGFVGVLDGRLREEKYSDAKTEAGRRNGGPAFEQEGAGGWAGFTDKYWLTALAPVNQSARDRAAFRHVSENGQDRWQVDFSPVAPVTAAPGATAGFATRLFAGAKEVHLLDAYASNLGITDFDKAIDFGWFYFLTKPFFYALDWLFKLTGNFGVAILVFTVALKILFFPLANKSYKSMARMKVLGPKMQELKERNKDDPAKMQQEMMALYKAEKINPASGCLPILVQIPVFFALYKVLFVTIEMRHAPFFGWIRDLSAPDPTNLFNLFGLIPWDPPLFLHMPAWAIIMGITMYVQFKLNPTPPDPIQAKLFGFMPIIFTFMLASFPAGLVIYWSWNNLLSVAQQYYITRHERAERSVQKATAKT